MQVTLRPLPVRNIASPSTAPHARDGNQRAADHLQHHAEHEQIAVAEESAAEVTAEHVQAIVEGAEYAHHGVGAAFVEAQPLGGVQHQRGVKHGEAQRGEDLDEEQRPAPGMAWRACGAGMASEGVKTNLYCIIM